MKEYKKYLKNGPLTNITSYIADEVLPLISRTDIETVQNILNYIRHVPDASNLNLSTRLSIAQELDIEAKPDDLEEKIKEKAFRQRTVEQILQDKYVTGCTDKALIFVTLCRACGIPASFVETFAEDWVKAEKDYDTIVGHAFAEIYIGGEWKVIDPSNGNGKLVLAPSGTYKIQERRYIKYAEGLDPHSLGGKSIVSTEDMAKKALQIQQELKIKLT